MRTAIGQPLNEVSEVVLKNVQSKNVSTGLTKYMANGVGRGISAQKRIARRDRVRSPPAGGENDDEEYTIDSAASELLTKEVA